MKFERQYVPLAGKCYYEAVVLDESDFTDDDANDDE